MGQNYIVVNVDKRLQLLPFDYNNGLKLMEWSYNRNCMVLALMNLLGGDWKCDRVYVAGEYADKDNPEYPYHQAIKKVLEELGTDNLYSYARKNFNRVLPDRVVENSGIRLDGDADPAEIRGCTEDLGYRYIYNHATRKFIDISKCPIEWTRYDVKADKGYVTKIAPLAQQSARSRTLHKRDTGILSPETA